MLGALHRTPGLWLLAAWRRAPAGVVVMATVTVGLVFAVFDTAARTWTVGPALLALDVTGAVYSWRAGRHSPSGPAPWRLIGAGRAASCAATVCLAAAYSTSGGWWSTGSLLRLVMYVLLAAGVLVGAVRQTAGRSRIALLAEILTVLAAGFMVIWYFALEPVVAAGQPSIAWIAAIGWPLGDVLLLAAVVAVVLRGAVTRFAAPITILSTGLAVYFLADVVWSSADPASTAATPGPATLVGLMAASLVMTAAPILAVSRTGQPFTRRTSRPPAWATHLPMTAMLLGCLLMLAVTVVERQMLPWGGLVCALTVMTGAAALRQLISLRDNRDQITSDPLTGLANRAGLDEALDRMIRRGEPAGLLLLDLDGFKLVNDAYGHAAGDTFLIHVARLLQDTVRGGSVCARIGGDEFAVLLYDITRVEQATTIAERILHATTARPATIDGDTVPVRASIGVALTIPGENGKALIRHADIAMYQSKRAGSHGHTCYEPSMVDHRAADAALADDLDHALDRGELHLLYQPQVDLATGWPIAAEALIRWQHPTRGLVSPIEFIPVAERSGAITGIGLWVLEQALLQLAAFEPTAAGRQPLHISVNLSPRQLREPTIVHDILAVISRVGADPHRLVLEVTESALVDETSGITALRMLREHGIRIAIDDFGTGYSSLQYLTRLPVDILKIDRSFVAELDDTREGAAVTDAIIRLSQVLHLSTVAEGIETEQQATELRALGCDIGQGYLYAKPLTPHDFHHFTTTTRPRA